MAHLPTEWCPSIVRKILCNLASPNLCVAIVAVLAVAGGALRIWGFVVGSNGLIRIGTWLISPLFLGSVLVGVIILIRVWAKRWRGKD